MLSPHTQPHRSEYVLLVSFHIQSPTARCRLRIRHPHGRHPLRHIQWSAFKHVDPVHSALHRAEPDARHEYVDCIGFSIGNASPYSDH